MHFFYKNQIILAEPQCSDFLSKFEAHLFLFIYIYIYIYIYHPHGVFLVRHGWFEGKILYFNTAIRVYHILFTDGATDYIAY